MILAILQARMSSSRLPGKVLLPILGKPMLLRQIERIRRSQCSEALVVATSTDLSDDGLSQVCSDANVAVFRGSLEDVLDRFYKTALHYRPEYVVRLTGDCPLIDPVVIDAVIDYCISNDLDYASNALEPVFPDGLDTEVMRFECLRCAWENAVLPSHREHVTPYIYQNPERFRIGRYKTHTDLSHLRWTVDEPEDYQLARAVYEALYPENPEFSMEDVINLFHARPELQQINAEVGRNEGLRTSLQRDKEFLRKS